MAVEGWYYLHANGDLIYKGAAYTNVGDFRESDLVRAFWPVEPDDTATKSLASRRPRRHRSRSGYRL